MKANQPKPANTSVVLTTLNGYIDQLGNIHAMNNEMGWNLISDQGGIVHSMKFDPENQLEANHRIENTTDQEVLFRWIINIITCSGETIKYDFGTLSIGAGCTRFINSIPYKCSRLLSSFGVSRIMVAVMVI